MPWVFWASQLRAPSVVPKMLPNLPPIQPRFEFPKKTAFRPTPMDEFLDDQLRPPSSV